MTTGSGNGAAVPAARARRGRRLWGVIAASVVGTSLEWLVLIPAFGAPSDRVGRLVRDRAGTREPQVRTP